MISITIETYAKLTAKGRCSGRAYYTYQVAAATVAEATAKAERTHRRRAAQGTVPQPPKGQLAAREGAKVETSYVIL
jgi:hypothetical protein